MMLQLNPLSTPRSFALPILIALLLTVGCSTSRDDSLARNETNESDLTVTDEAGLSDSKRIVSGEQQTDSETEDNSEQRVDTWLRRAETAFSEEENDLARTILRELLVFAPDCDAG